MTAPIQLRRQVLRQTRYALNLLALENDAVPPEGPVDVAITNGLAAIVAFFDESKLWMPPRKNGRPRVLPATELLPLAASFDKNADRNVVDYDEAWIAGERIHEAVLREAIDLTQPFRHGTADDEFIEIRPEHIQAITSLDRVPGLGVLETARQHPAFADLVTTLYLKETEQEAGIAFLPPKERSLSPDIQTCDSCQRLTFVIQDFDADGGINSPGVCLACGHIVERDDAQLAMYQAALDRED